jgi:selenide, water dikinase
MPDSEINKPVRLTSLSSCAGCAAKIPAERLVQILQPLESIFQPRDYPNLLVGLESPDDAAVWKLDEERALIVTTDFFTPIVDTPYEYGAIAAANALSDIYAMGGKPFLALSIAALPPDLPTEALSEILRGGANKVNEAGAVIAGGHTIKDDEPKFGLAVLGMVNPKEYLTKGSLRPGDRLVLTKPLGFGVTTTALKQQLAEDADIQEVISWMTRLNAKSAQLANEFHLKSGTDVTGFSLMGHGWEMAKSSQVGLNIHFSQLPFVSCAMKYARQGTFPGGAADNKHYFEPHVRYDTDLEDFKTMLLFDPQTSGGLLMGVPESSLPAFLARAVEINQPAWVIGEVVEGDHITILS